MEFSSFLTSLGTSFVIFVILLCLFAWLSTKPQNEVVYYPNRILRGLDLGSRTRNPFSWIKEALSSAEDDIVSVSGVDTAVYFVFLSTALTILVVAGLLLLPTLLPVAITDHSVKLTNATSQVAFNDLDKLSMGHVGQNSPRLWAFLIAVYWVSLVTYFLLWKAYKHVSELRAQALMSSEVRAEQFAVLVRDIPTSPEGETRKEQVNSFFKSIYPDTFYRAMIVTDNKEAVLSSAQLNSDRMSSEQDLGGAGGLQKEANMGEAIYAKSKTVVNPEGVRPTRRIGLLGLCGEKVDTLEYCNKKINELSPKLEAEQKVTLQNKQLSSALVFFSNSVTAASAAQSLHARMVDSWTVMDAPEPRQLIWSNLSLDFYEREVRNYVVYLIVALTVLFYMIPIGIISAFTTLKNLMKLLPFIKPVVKIVAIRTILEACLPQIALIVFLAMLPKLLMFLSKAEGIPSESHLVRATSGKYFYFIVLNVFIGVTLGGTLFTTLKWRTIQMVLFFVGYGLELSRLVPLTMYHQKRRYLCKTEAELKEAWASGDFGYATRVPGDMLIITIVLCYSVIAPALKVYIPSYESYGRMWPHLHTRILAALLLYQVTMLGYFVVKTFYYTPLLFPLPIMSLLFAFVCRKKFYRFFQCTTLEVACHGLKEHPNMEHVFRSFVPPYFNNNNNNSQSSV
ncbi:hypothetical protein Cgig2_029713 [Carnegiea gigantea]|uniref:Uncharacterized protein n=1 Tax=Carnegiea gigantea TaxID=171969 RepID=A0A9Q1GPB8_9CARY|nr:hypothetical protein Cgig2_029713 [Carnegiea gigantea]